MLSFLWRKMWKNKWMMVCLLIGNLLLVGIVAATPLYINATMRRILYQDMRSYQLENDTFPAMVSLNFGFNRQAQAARAYTYHNLVNNYVDMIHSELGIPVVRTMRTDSMTGWHLQPNVQREVAPRPRVSTLSGVSGMEENVELMHGRLPANYLVEGNIIEVIATEAAMLRNNLLLNELLRVQNVRFRGEESTLYVVIVGIYELAEGSDEFWTVSNLDHHSGNLLMSDELLIATFVEDYYVDYRISVTWHHLLDYRQMSSREVQHYLETLAAHQEYFDSFARNMLVFTENFSQTIANHTQRTGPLAVTLWVLQVPIYVMLAFYIYMVSRQILQLEQNEISVLKSRGASRGQILGLYSLQGLFIALICYPAGMAIGVFLCRVLGASSGFLDLVQRGAIIVEITPDALLYAGLAMFLSFLTMFLPVIRFSRVGIVDHKRSRTGKLAKPAWQRFFLDIVCLVVSLYALHNFNSQRDAMAMAVRDSQAVDPLLLLSSSLFIMGLGLFFLRIFPHAVKLVFKLGGRFWSPSAYASLIKVIRSAGEEQFIMIFLLFTLSVGTFSAQAARTINLNSDHQIKYVSGADLVFREHWRSQTPMGGQTIFFEPDFQRFTNFEEVEALTRVQSQNVNVLQAGGMRAMDNVQLMGIETDSFGDTAWFRGDLLRTHINHFLNALASHPDGLLLSYNFRSMHGAQVGDTIHFADELGNFTRGTIVGFVEHWPGFVPVSRVYFEGQTLEVYSSLIIANLGYLQMEIGVQPYYVWMRTNTESNTFFTNFAAENRLNIISFSDANAAVIASRSDPILQGTNGVLTVGFIVTLLICFTGFLIYWILSIRSRVLQFGIFRAMGMSMRSLLGLLINEQLFITFTAIALGALVGEISAWLFVPLIQLSYSSADQIIPLLIVTQAQDYINLYTVVGTMILICLAILGWYISKIKIAQALKLGED